jgi:hypothetical protein
MDMEFYIICDSTKKYLIYKINQQHIFYNVLIDAKKYFHGEFYIYIYICTYACNLCIIIHAFFLKRNSSNIKVLCKVLFFNWLQT